MSPPFGMCRRPPDGLILSRNATFRLSFERIWCQVRCAPLQCAHWGKGGCGIAPLPRRRARLWTPPQPRTGHPMAPTRRRVVPHGDARERGPGHTCRQADKVGKCQPRTPHELAPLPAALLVLVDVSRGGVDPAAQLLDVNRRWPEVVRSPDFPDDQRLPSATASSRGCTASGGSNLAPTRPQGFRDVEQSGRPADPVCVPGRSRCKRQVRVLRLECLR
jgi:hypothetical protein